MTEKNFNYNINALRAYAILMILLLHALLIYGENLPMKIRKSLRYYDFGVGVEILFVIAGYFLSRWLIINSARIGQEFTQFCIKKIKRLWPAVFVWCLIPLVFSLLMPDSVWLNKEIMWKKFISGITMLRNFEEINHHSAFGYLWAVSLEFQFFIAFTLIFYLIGARPMFYLSVFSILILAAFRNTVIGAQDFAWLFRFDALLLGYVITYIQVLNPGALEILTDGLKKISAFKHYFLLFLLILLCGASLRVFGAYPQLKFSISALFAGLLFVIALTTPKSFEPPGKPLRKLTRYIASRSYALYCCHIPSWFMADTLLSLPFISQYHNLDRKAIFYIGILFMFISAEITYQLVERKFR